MKSPRKSFLQKCKDDLCAHSEIDPKKGAEYFAYYQRKTAYDRRYFFFNVRAIPNGTSIVLSGEVQYPEQIQGFIYLMTMLGVQTENEVTVITEGNLREASYAITNVSYASCYAEPDFSTEQVTQVRLGERVQIIKESVLGYHLVRGQDGYLGWAPESSFIACSKQEWLAWGNEPKVRFLEPAQIDGLKICLGTELPSRERGKVGLPNGETLNIESADVKWTFVEHPNQENASLRKRVVQVAETWLDSRYQWGGRTEMGVDCSGFVQGVYGICGIYLPRDACHQFMVGRVTGGRDFCQMVEGDLLFFLGKAGQVAHVAISLGEGRFIHSGDGHVQFASLFPDEEGYAEKRSASFFCAKRVIQS